MSADVTLDNLDLKAQYAKRVDADLERNAKDRDRISSELTTLQEQLRTLDDEHMILLSVRQALDEGTPASQAAGGRRGRSKGGVPASPVESSTVKAKHTAKTTGRNGTERESSGRGRPPGPSAVPVLRVLAAAELAKHSEPRSAAEVTTALTQAHPERKFIDQVVRNTLENLVARGQAQRVKQQRSVFYSIIDSANKAESRADSSPATA
jgi:hypothetical protein